MKSIRFSVVRRLLFLAAIYCLCFTETSKCLADDDDHTDEALAAAEAWVDQIDSGKYESSYEAAGGALHEKVDETKWVAVLQTIRTPWGDVVSRKQTSHIYKPNGFGGSEGEFMVISYDTSFKKMEAATEVVVLKREGGKWSAAGYSLGPKPTDTSDDQAAAPMPDTEMTSKTVHNPQ